jgi:DNA-binding IclR family transcriptional regulator
VPGLAQEGFVAEFDARGRYRLGAQARGSGEGEAGAAG